MGDYIERDPITGKPVATQPRNPLALGLIIVGCLAMAIATFLPFDEPVGFHRIQHNTLIQGGTGWILIALAVITAVTGCRVGQKHSASWWLPLIPCGLAGLLVIWLATDTDLRTLYPVGPDGALDRSQPGLVTALGIGQTVARRSVPGAGGADRAGHNRPAPALRPTHPHRGRFEVDDALTCWGGAASIEVLRRGLLFR